MGGINPTLSAKLYRKLTYKLIPVTDTDPETLDDDLARSVQEEERLKAELTVLFGGETVALACQIDIADLNLNEEMTRCIAAGIKQLKQLKHDPQAQVDLVSGMEQGARLLLCMWIMDMDLLEKIQNRSWLG